MYLTPLVLGFIIRDYTVHHNLTVRLRRQNIAFTIGAYMSMSRATVVQVSFTLMFRDVRCADHTYSSKSVVAFNMTAFHQNSTYVMPE